MKNVKYNTSVTICLVEMDNEVNFILHIHIIRKVVVMGNILNNKTVEVGYQ